MMNWLYIGTNKLRKMEMKMRRKSLVAQEKEEDNGQ